MKLEEKLWLGINILFGLELMTFTLTLLVKGGSVALTASIMLISWTYFIVTKEQFNDKATMNAFKFNYIGTMFSTIAIVDLKLFPIAETLGETMNVMVVLINILMFTGFFAMSKSDFYQNAKDGSVNNHLLGTIFPKKIKKEAPGDIQLCFDDETGQPVILPEKDRFLHMLILGPTGSGKTSQTIIPMIHQDMQNEECGITVIEPKGDLAEKVDAMGRHFGRKTTYFNPVQPDCPSFNPLQGREDEVIENMATTFKMLNPDSPQFFLDMNEQLIRKSLLVLKRLLGDRATLIELARLVQNSGNIGRKMVMDFSRISALNEAEAKENSDVASWFLNDYFNEKSKTYEHCSGLRSQVAKITSNKYLRKVLNPQNGLSDIDFVKHLDGNGVLTISTAQGSLGDLGKFLGYFIILNLQSAVFKRPGDEFSRSKHYLYIDEFQTYSNPGFANMLTQGRSYRVASHLATQNRALMAMGGGRDGKSFVELVSTNARNLVIYPGANVDDSKYYSDQFGEVMNTIKQKGVTRQKFNPLYGFQQLNYPSEQVRVTEQMEARFSPSELIFKPFGQITYLIIKDSSIQAPGVGNIEFIPKELNDTLDKMVVEFRDGQEHKRLSLESSPEGYGSDIVTNIQTSEGDSPIIRNESNNDVIHDDVSKSIIISDDVGDDMMNDVIFEKKTKPKPIIKSNKEPEIFGYTDDSMDDLI